MVLNWITRCKDWAFRHLAEHVASALPQHEHRFDAGSGDVTIVCSPNFLKNHPADSRTVLRIDSNRWYEGLYNETM